MFKHLKYLGILSLLCFSFFYTEKIAEFMHQKDPLYVSIETVKDDYKEDYVNAIIEDDYIIPGLMGKEIDVEKSFQKMQNYGYFTENNIVYENKEPEISLKNNSQKIIKEGNSLKKAVAFITQNVSFATYLAEMSIPYNILVTKETAANNYYMGTKINFDKQNYEATEKILKKEKNNLCFVKNNFQNICLKYKKNLIEETVSINKNNLPSQYKKIEAGYILYLEDDLDLSGLKVLIKEINFKGLKIVSLTDLISEERT